MEIRELRAFLAAVEEQSLSAAARRIHVSQPAISQIVKSLEKQLGTTLLTRTHHGVSPTTAGKILVPEARALIAHHDRVMSAVTGHTETDGLLALGVPLEFPGGNLATALAAFRDARPGVTVRLDHHSSSEQFRAVKRGELDMALVRDRPSDHTLDATLVLREPMGVIVPDAAALTLTDGDTVALERLQGLRWTGFSRSESPAWHDQVVATLRAHGIDVDAENYSSITPQIPEVKLASIGAEQAFALASPGWSQPLPTGLTWIRLRDDPLIRRTWAVWDADSRNQDLATLVSILEDLSNSTSPFSRPASE